MLSHCSSDSNHHHHHQGIIAPPATTMAASTTFSLFFPMPSSKAPCTPAAADGYDDDSHSSITTSPSSPSSSSTGSVDCTLSLGTPSSRRAAATATVAANKQRAAQPSYPASSCGTVSWDAAAAADQPCCCCCQGGGRPSAPAASKGAVPCARHAQDPMLMDRRCANCGTSSTPLWRNGPRGPKSLCNACGIRFKKEERRAAAAAAAASAMDQTGCSYLAQYGAAAAERAPYVGEGPSAFPFPCDGGDVGDAEAAVPPFFAWRLNVVAPAPEQAAAFAAVWPERTSLFQYN